MDSIQYGKVLHYGSNNAHRLGLYSAKTMLQEMLGDNAAGFEKISAIGEEMTKRLNQVAKDVGVNMRVQSCGSMFHPMFTDEEVITGYRQFCERVNLPKYGEFTQHLREQGVFFTGVRALHNVACTAHTSVDIEKSIDAAGIALERMKSVK
jgi:glutamate-1-semialdehyde 2,1-aminomutase